MEGHSNRKWLAWVLPTVLSLLASAEPGNTQSTSITGLQLVATSVAASASATQPAASPVLAQSLSSVPLPAPTSSGSAADVEALKIFQQGSSNFKQLQTQGLKGWTANTDPCQGWTGINCGDDGRVITLELGGWGLETRLPPELSGLSELQILNLTGNNLLGGLPSNWGSASIFTNLTVLDLSNNPNLSGALPPNWGTQGAFDMMTTLNLGGTGVSGQLPLAWGGQLSLPSLIALDLSSNTLDGTLPAGWGTAGAFAQLQMLKLTNNTLTGSLPAQWGSSTNGDVLPALRELDLANNSLSGYLPSGWGSGFQNLTTLVLYGNHLTGQLPSPWAQASRWSALSKLDIHANRLTGSIPSSWGSWSILPHLSLVLQPGNSLCGSLPYGLQQVAITADGSAINNASLQSCMVPPSFQTPPQTSPTQEPSPSPAQTALQGQQAVLQSSPLPLSPPPPPPIPPPPPQMPPPVPASVHKAPSPAPARAPSFPVEPATAPSSASIPPATAPVIIFRPPTMQPLANAKQAPAPQPALPVAAPKAAPEPAILSTLAADLASTAPLALLHPSQQPAASPVASPGPAMQPPPFPGVEPSAAPFPQSSLQLSVAPAPEPTPQVAAQATTKAPEPAAMPVQVPVNAPAPLGQTPVPLPEPPTAPLPSLVPVAASAAPQPAAHLLPVFSAPAPTVAAPVPAPSITASAVLQPTAAPEAVPAAAPEGMPAAAPVTIPAVAPELGPSAAPISAPLPAVVVAAPQATAPAQAPAAMPVAAPLPAGLAQTIMPPGTPVPAPSLENIAQISVRYNLTGPNLDASNDTVRSAILSAMGNTLGLPSTSQISLESLTPLPFGAGRRLLITPDAAQAIFQINTTSDAAPGVITDLNNNSTTSRFGQQLSAAGLPSIQPTLADARITNPLITNPLAPASVAPAAQAPQAVVPVKTSSSGTSISTGAIIGIAIGAVLAIIIAAALLCCWRRRKGAALQSEKEDIESPQKQREQERQLWSITPWRTNSPDADASESPLPQKQPLQAAEAQQQQQNWKTPFRKNTATRKEMFEAGKSTSVLSERAAKAALKNRKPPESDTPESRAIHIPLTAGAPAEGAPITVMDSQFTTVSTLDERDSFEEEERHTIKVIPSSPVGSPFAKQSSGSLARKQRIDSAQSLKNEAGPGAASLPGTDTPPSDHTAMSPEIVAEPVTSEKSEVTPSGSTTGSLGSGEVASKSLLHGQQGSTAESRLSGRERVPRSGSQQLLAQRSGSGAVAAAAATNRDTPHNRDLGSGRSRSAVLLRALERELRSAQDPPPSSYSRRHTGGEPLARRPRPDAALAAIATEKREVPMRGEGPPTRKRPAVADPARRLHDPQRTFNRPASGDVMRLRTEVDQLLGGGFLKRNGEDRAPPPSYHRRPAEDANPTRTASGRMHSGAISRHSSGLYLPSRQSSAAVPGRVSGGVEGLGRPSAGQGAMRRQALSGGSGDRTARTGSGSLRPATGDAASRPGPHAADGTGRSGERLARRQQTSQREVLLRDLERQLGLEPTQPAKEPRMDAASRAEAREGREGREQRVDGRREIAQRARKLLEDLGGLEPGEDLNRQLERIGSRRSRQADSGNLEMRRTTQRKS